MLQRLRGRRDVQRPGEAGQVHTAHTDQEPQGPGQHLQLLLHLLARGRVSLEKEESFFLSLSCSEDFFIGF